MFDLVSFDLDLHQNYLNEYSRLGISLRAGPVGPYEG